MGVEGEGEGEGLVVATARRLSSRQGLWGLWTSFACGVRHYQHLQSGCTFTKDQVRSKIGQLALSMILIGVMMYVNYFVYFGLDCFLFF